MTDRPSDPDDQPMARLVASLRSFGLVLVGLVAVALVAGVVFSRTDPQRAASLLIRDRVTTEPEGEVVGAPAPSSGEKVGAPTCGVAEAPVDVQAQVDAIASGVVVLQYRDAADADVVEAAAGERLMDVLVAPNPDLEDAVVATAWGRRMRLDAADEGLLTAFVTAHAGFGPDVAACAPGQ